MFRPFKGDPDELARLVQDVIDAMQELHLKRLIFMVAMGIYNEIPASVCVQDNVDNNPAQIHNLRAAKVIEASSLDYTFLRPGFLIPGPDSVVITHRGENVSGNTTTISSVGAVAVQLVTGNLQASRDSFGLNQPTTKKI
ncbi:NAD(P)H-binding protein [Companilactobacillus futsaii]|nr:NAD(P)H-binding protein [Companilactobacillus futsaii]